MNSRSLIKHIWVILIAFVVIVKPASAQNERLEIHHINVENGDATLIVVHDIVANTYNALALIDGGNSGTGVFIQPYFSNLFGATNLPVKIKYMILSHFHADHFRGLLGIEDGNVFKADFITDPGGYDLPAKYADINPPVPDNKKERGLSKRGKTQYVGALKTAFNNNYITKRSEFITTFPGNIDKGIELGKVNGVSVYLKCVAGGGYALGKDGTIVNNAASYPTRLNPNNFTLGFVLRYGQFRYFTGGDMGGKSGTGCAGYLDQENSVDEGFSKVFPEISYPFNNEVIKNTGYYGHICAFKVSHHGSNCSSNNNFLRTTSAAVFISAGNMPSWGLPKPDFINRIANNLHPLSQWTSANQPLGVKDIGFYFTNLYNFKKKGKPKSRTAAIDAFANKDTICFNYGNDFSATGARGNNQYQSDNVKDKDSYVLVVAPQNIATQSVFTVYRRNYNRAPQDSLMASFKCHKDAKQP